MTYTEEKSLPAAGAAAIVAKDVSNPTENTLHNEAARVAKDSFLLTAGLAATWGISLLVRLALPRFLDEATFGRLVFCESLALLLFAPLTLGIDIFARREVPRQPDVYRHIARGLAAARGGTTLLFAAGGLAVLALTGRPSDVLILFSCFAVAHFFLNGATINSAFLQGTGRTGAVTSTQIITKFLWAATAVTGLLMGGGALVIPIALAASEALRMLWLRHRNGRQFGQPTRTNVTATRRALIASFPFVTTQISIGLSNSLDTTMVGFFAGDSEVGIYGTATLIGSAALFLAPALGAALLPALSRSKLKAGDHAVTLLGRSVLHVVIAVAAPAITLLALEADDVINRLFGERYAPAIPSLRVLAMMFLLTYVASICSAILVVLGRSWRVTAVGLGTVALNTIANLVLLGPAARHWGPGGPSLAASWAVFAAEACSVIALLGFLGRPILNGAMARCSLQAAAGCGLLYALHRTLGGNSVGLLILEAVAALGIAAIAAYGPVQAVRTRETTATTDNSRHQRQLTTTKEHDRANPPD